MILRAVAWTLLAASIAAATLTREPARTPPTSGGYRVVSADFHVHAFLGDGALPPWDIRRESARRGLDVAAVTNHNQMYALHVDRALFAPPAHPLMVPGEELTMPEFHVIALGVREPVDWRLPLADALRAIHAQGGVAIGAHPVTDGWQTIDDDTLALFDGLEVAHPAGRHAKGRRRMDEIYARARRLKPAIAAIGSSDFHFGAPIGYCHTRLLVRDLSIDAVFDAIRAGRTVAYDAAGRAYGDPEWIAAVRGAAPTAAGERRHNATIATAWVALAILVLFGGTRAPGD